MIPVPDGYTAVFVSARGHTGFLVATHHPLFLV
jgi:hypothetical protein